jgi:nitrogen-specific signal transduction histidine kinase
MDRNPFNETENEKSSFISFLKGVDTKTPESKEKNVNELSNVPSWFLLLAELVHNVKNTLNTIKSFTHLSREKFRDMEFGEYFCKTVTQDIIKTDLFLNCFLDYLKINSPIPKTNTVHIILESVLKINESLFEEKRIKIFKKQYEKDIPETTVHDEQLKYMLNSIIQYAIPLIPPNGGIGFLTKSFDAQDVKEDFKASQEKEVKYIEILIGFTGYEKSSKPLEPSLGTPSIRTEETNDFILRLIKEVVQKNRGMLKIKVDEEKPITLISLILPVERRRVVQYQPTTA